MVRAFAAPFLLLSACLLSACARPAAANIASATPQTAQRDSPVAPSTDDPRLPPVDRVWTGAEYARALALVRSKSAEGPQALSRFTSASPAFLSRIVNPENLAPGRNRSIPITNRIDQLEAIHEPLAKIAQLYAAAWDAGQPFDRELLALDGFVLHLFALIWEINDELLVTIDPSDPVYESKMNSLAEMPLATEETTWATLKLAKMAIGHNSAFWDDVRLDWATLVHRVSRDAQTSILREMDSIDRRAIDPAVRQAIHRVLVAISSHPQPTFVITATDIRSASGRIICPLPRLRADGIAAAYQAPGAERSRYRPAQ